MSHCSAGEIAAELLAWRAWNLSAPPIMPTDAHQSSNGPLPCCVAVSPHARERHLQGRLEGLAQGGGGFAEVVPVVGVEVTEGTGRLC